MLRQAQELDQPYLVSFMSFEIDAMNLATGLKLFTMGFAGELQRFFLPGGRRVGLPLFELLAAGRSGMPWRSWEIPILRRVAEVRDLATLERGLRCILLAKAHEGVKDVLGAGMANDYILRKEWEAGRIRLLARRSFLGCRPLPSNRRCSASEDCGSD